MKAKTIEKVITKKLDKWVSTITDPEVQYAVRKDAIVTGRSIASLLLNEKVNDFDVYFRTKNTVKLVAQYYAKNTPVRVIDGVHHKTDREDLSKDDESQWDNFVKDLTPDRIKLFVKGLNYYSVTGDGSLMAEQDEVEQTKELFSSIADAKEMVQEGSYSPLFFTANAITLSDQIQLVIRFHGNPEELHKNYDFVHATNYYDYHQQKLTLRKDALESLLTKELRYIGSLYPVTSIIRSKKFIKRGWSITAGEYLKIMFQIAELDLKDPAVLSAQLIGIDISYFSIMIEALENRDMSRHAELTYGYICEVIDRIFN